MLSVRRAIRVCPARSPAKASSARQEESAWVITNAPTEATCFPHTAVSMHAALAGRCAGLARDLTDPTEADAILWCSVPASHGSGHTEVSRGAMMPGRPTVSRRMWSAEPPWRDSGLDSGRGLPRLSRM